MIVKSYSVLVLIVSVVWIAACASTPDTPEFEAQFNQKIFTNVATSQQMKVIAPRKLAENCRIVRDPAQDLQAFSSELDGRTAEVLAGRGMGIMLPIQMDRFFLNPTVMEALPADGTSYGVLFRLIDYKPVIDEENIIHTEVVLSADVYDPAGNRIARTEATGRGVRRRGYRFYAAVELSCANALADGLNRLGEQLISGTVVPDQLLR